MTTGRINQVTIFQRLSRPVGPASFSRTWLGWIKSK